MLVNPSAKKIRKAKIVELKFPRSLNLNFWWSHRWRASGSPQDPPQSVMRAWEMARAWLRAWLMGELAR
jgi:hypothetical protein